MLKFDLNVVLRPGATNCEAINDFQGSNPGELGHIFAVPSWRRGEIFVSALFGLDIAKAIFDPDIL